MVWDHGVGGSNPFTQTILSWSKSVGPVILTTIPYLVLSNSTGRPGDVESLRTETISGYSRIGIGNGLRKDSTVDVKASKLEKEDKVLVRYQELKDEAANAAGGAVMTRNEKREMLAKMARDTNLTARERQAAIDIDNRMEDEYVQTNVNLNVTKLEDLI